MARPRTIKRNSSPSSYKSTLTTIAFMALCAIGVWMLTSNPQVTPQTTNHVSKSAMTTTATATNVAADTDVSISNVVEHAESRKKDTRVYEDNPGDLPDDAIKSDELKSNDDSGSKEESSDGKQEADGGDSQESSSQDLKGEESAISAVMGSQRLPFPSRVFDLIHCARCRVPLLKKIRCLFRWQATLGIESPSPAWRLFCLVSNSSCYFASYVCIDGIYVLGACDYQER